MNNCNHHYRGRLAPSPTGYLHLGHARTFWVAAGRARAVGGMLILRNDDLDRGRCRPEFTEAAIKDLHWLGLSWGEGPDAGGPHAPYSQSQRTALYRAALERLHAARLIFPCRRSRQDVAEAMGAPHEDGGNEEPLYPAHFRPSLDAVIPPLGPIVTTNWRFRVPNGQVIRFQDGALGFQETMAGEDFGDFLVWRKDDLPSYQLACVVDDALMGVTEVVRGVDLITSTFRQLLLYSALGYRPPAFYHCPLVKDEQGARLAKRHDALSLRALRAGGISAEKLIEQFGLGKDG